MPTLAPSDGNIIVRFFSFVLSIIPWAFSVLWGIVKFFWGILVFAWDIIGHIWTVFILAINVVYSLMVHWTYNRRFRHKNVGEFFETMGVYLVVPLVVNWLFIRR